MLIETLHRRTHMESIKNIAQDILTGLRTIILPLSTMLIVLFSIEYFTSEAVAESVFITGIIVYCLYCMGNIRRPL